MSAPKPMLCQEGKGRPFPSGAAWVIEPKLDGWRFLFHVLDDQEVRSYAGRNGSDRTGQPAAIEEALRYLPPDTILDAELVVLGERSPKVATVLAHPHAGILHAHVFDVLRVAGTNVHHLPWDQRRTLLEKAAEGFDGVTVTLVRPVAAILSTHEQWIADGYEGSVAKRVDSRYYEGKRSQEWVKFKPQATVEAVILSLVPGNGKWEGYTGAFEVKLLDSGLVTTCATTTDAMREHVKANPDEYLGRTCELYVHAIMESGLPRHPIFKQLRPDRDKVAA